MSYNDIKVGEAISFCDTCLYHSAIFKKYEITKALLEFIEELRNELSLSEREERLSDEEIKKLKNILVSIDDEFDDAVRVLFGAVDLLSKAFPEKKMEYQQVKTTLIPDGMKFILTNYRNESGEAARIKARVELNPNIFKLLEESELNKKSLLDWYNQIVNLGEQLGNISNQLDMDQAKKTKNKGTILEFQSHQKWCSFMVTLKRMVELAGWSKEEYKLIFDDIDMLSAERSNIRRLKKESKSKT